MEKIIDERMAVLKNAQEHNPCIEIVEGEEPRQISAQVIVPILCEGQTIGAVITLSKKANQRFSDVEKKTAEVAASFLGAQMAQ